MDKWECWDNLIHSLLAANLNNVIGFGQLIDYSNFPRLIAQVANTKALVLPPWDWEAWWVPVRVGHQWGNVQVPASWTIVPLHISLWIHCHLWLLCVVVQPVWYVCSSCIKNRVYLWLIKGLLVSRWIFFWINCVRSYTCPLKLTQQSSAVQCFDTSSGV